MVEIRATSVTATRMGDEAASRHTKLMHAAQQFEAVMLGELMKPLSQSSAIGSDDQSTSNGPMQSFGIEAVAGALARSGALGFAHRIAQSVEGHASKINLQTSAETAQVHSRLADDRTGGISQ